MSKMQINECLFDKANFDVRRRLHVTFQKFRVANDRAVVGESLLRLEQICKNRNLIPSPSDPYAATLFEMLKFYRSLN